MDNEENMFEKMISCTKRSYDSIWHNTDPTCTPEAMWEALGTAGVSALQIHIAACTFIETIRSGTMEARYLSAALPYRINADGSITVNPPVEVPVEQPPQV